jgi:tetratricopeptide (TPR) repeat protein
MTQEIVDRDHRFWSKYSERLVGNWLTYDTSVSNICRVAEQIYIKRNLKDLKVDGTDVRPDPRFVRDDDAQKAFSKLRSAIAGVYFWRINEAGRRAAEAAQRGDAAAQSRHTMEQQRMIKECDFAFRQAFAFCPFSPEAVFRYTNLLISMGRTEDALHIARTFLKLDPHNRSARDLIEQLTAIRQNQGASAQAQMQVTQMENAYRANPANFQAGLQAMAANVQFGRTNQALALLDSLAQTATNEVTVLLPVLQAYQQLGQPAKAQLTLTRLVPLCDRTLNDPQADTPRLQAALQTYQLANNASMMERALERLVQVNPASPEFWYDLGALRSFMQKTNGAITAVSNALHHSDARLKQAPNAQNLRSLAASDGRFNNVRAQPEFQKLTAPR